MTAVKLVIIAGKKYVDDCRKWDSDHSMRGHHLMCMCR